MVTTMYPKSLILIVIEALHDDGSIFSASINVVLIALTDAGISTNRLIGAVTCRTITNGSFCLDLTKEEEKNLSYERKIFIHSMQLLKML
jgi:ribonuclease PH